MGNMSYVLQQITAWRQNKLFVIFCCKNQVPSHPSSRVSHSCVLWRELDVFELSFPAVLLHGVILQSAIPLSGGLQQLQHVLWVLQKEIVPQKIQ